MERERRDGLITVLEYVEALWREGLRKAFGAILDRKSRAGKDPSVLEYQQYVRNKRREKKKEARTQSIEKITDIFGDVLQRTLVKAFILIQNHPAYYRKVLNKL
jgi:hypothetical protein